MQNYYEAFARMWKAEVMTGDILKWFSRISLQDHKKNPQWGYLVLGLTFETGTYKIWSVIVNRYNEMPAFSKLLLSHPKNGTEFILE